MDWSRAKTVLIWSFLLLNVLLSYQLWMDELNLTTFTENATRREEMNRMLEQKDIRLNAIVPEGTPATLREITVRLRSGGGSADPNPLSTPFSRYRVNDMVFIREVLSPDVPDLGTYEPDPFAARADEVVSVMNQLHSGLPMFEMRLELYGNEQMIDRYRITQSEVELTETAEEQPQVGQDVLSAYVMLGSLAENYLPRGSVVVDVRLGYHGPIFESETQVLAPYWRVVLMTGETYYVHAINGAVEGPASESKGTQED